jgi:uncharacterized protein YjbJ (UPF0337 family)
MNWDAVSGNWSQVKGGVKSKWAKLTDDDIGMLDGKREHLVGKIVERYGVLKEEAAKQVDEWAHTLGKELDAVSAKLEESTKAAKEKAAREKETLKGLRS